MGCVITLPTCPQRIWNEIPTGAKNGINLNYSTANVFDPLGLVVKIDGVTKTPTLDFLIDSDNKGFTLVIDADDSNRLNSPLCPTEDLLVNYTPQSGNGCVISL